MLVVLILCRPPCVNSAMKLSSLELVQASERQLDSDAKVLLKSSEIAWDRCSGLRNADDGAKDHGWDEPEEESREGDAVGFDVDEDGGI